MKRYGLFALSYLFTAVATWMAAGWYINEAICRVRF